MKKFFKLSLFALMIASLFAAVPVSAKSGRVHLKGQIVELVSDLSLRLETHLGEQVTITVADSHMLAGFAAGDQVLVKGFLQPDESVLADWIRRTDPGSEMTASAGKMNSAYCAGDKQAKPHPLALKLEEMFGVTPEWVMKEFCDGQGMGTIMLALKTGGADMETASALLKQHSGGMGWGQIWKEAGLIGSEKEANSPPGLLKKPEQAGPKKDK